MAEITAQQLIDNWQLSQKAGADWPDDTVLIWLNEAINDMSIHIPPIFNETIATSADVHAYDLPQFARSIVNVEYPAGEDPPEYLDRRSTLHPAFWNRSGFYDFYDRNRQAPADPQLIISANPTGSQNIEVTFTASYGVDLALIGEVPVPNQFHHLLMLFVNWRAILNEHAEEIQDPDTTTLLISQLMSNADRSMREYYEAIRQAIEMMTTAGPAILQAGWGNLDKYDRIY